MGMPVKLSDELVKLARDEAASADRSITAQIEHWAKLGRSVETALRHEDVRALKQSAGPTELGGPTRRAVLATLERAIGVEDTAALARTLKRRRVVYQSDPSGSGLIERLEPDGTRTLGRLEKRRFAAACRPRRRASR